MARFPLAIVTFLFSQPGKWKQLNYEEFQPDHVNALWRACEDNISIPHRFVAYTERAAGIECERRKCFPDIKVRRPDGGRENGCYQRLRMYDPDVQASLDADFVLILDLDTVLMRDCTALLERCMEHDFTALRGSPWANGTLCSWYNGSFQLCRAGARPEFWREFNRNKFWLQRENYRMPNGKRPHGTDQAWLTVCAGDRERTIWHEDDVYQYRNHRQRLPADAAMAFFAGPDKPWFDKIRLENPAVADRWWQYANG